MFFFFAIIETNIYIFLKVKDRITRTSELPESQQQKKSLEFKDKCFSEKRKLQGWGAVECVCVREKTLKYIPRLRGGNWWEAVAMQL